MKIIATVHVIVLRINLSRCVCIYKTLLMGLIKHNRISGKL